mgnify:CR=1 FL=1
MVAGLCCLVERQPQNTPKYCISMEKVYALFDCSDSLEKYLSGVFTTRKDAEDFITKKEEELGYEIRLDCKIEVRYLNKGEWWS